MRLPRSPIAINFFIAMLLAIAWYGYQIVLGLQETDPSVARADRSAIGAVVLAFFELLLVVLYLRRGELVGLVRVIAGIVGLIGLLQSIVVPLIVRELYGDSFPTAGHVLLWYAYGSHLLYALVGDGRDRR